jgi:hypothetical protein
MIAHNTLPPDRSDNTAFASVGLVPSRATTGGYQRHAMFFRSEAKFAGSCQLLVPTGASPTETALPPIGSVIGKAAFFFALLLALTISGCASYQFGSASLFRPGIRTVHVPIVRNETFRPDLGVRLSEALVRKIELRTPYKTTGDPNADSTLTCVVVNESKRVLTETDTDDPRALDAAVAVRATWTGRGGELLMQNSVVPTGDIAITFGQDARFVPEAGQSIDSATQQAIEDLAERIVSQMEMRW